MSRAIPGGAGKYTPADSEAAVLPELPEIEHLRRTLEPLVTNARVVSARLVRRDVAHAAAGASRVSRRDLLQDATIVEVTRLGKQLAMIADDGRVLCVHLGMSGRLLHLPPGRRLGRADHVHARWQLDRGRLVFRDPRRFGGLWTFPTPQRLRSDRWSALGPDALTIDARTLRRRLEGRRRPIKAALLDQSVLAGVGNIYADESLYAAGIHPCSTAAHIDAADVRTLAAAIRRILRRSIRFGGSTLRDYTDANGRRGDYVARHAVYDRAGQPCRRCGHDLSSTVIAQRTTVYCGVCQSGSSS